MSCAERRDIMKGRMKGRIEGEKYSAQIRELHYNTLCLNRLERANERANSVGRAIIFIPVHEGCGDTVILNVPRGLDFGKWLEEQIKENPKVTTTELALRSGKGIRTIKRYISRLPHVRYVGSGYSGHWEIRN